MEMQQTIQIFKYAVRCIALVSCFACSCFAQSQQGIRDKFENYSRHTLQEKLFVHTDQATYFAGELIWFKVYAVDGIDNKPLSMSKVAYIDILDDKQISVMQAKIPLVNGSGSGSIFIPVTANNGNYKLRAYTSWMKNFSPEYYFEKAVTIINPQIIPEANTAENSGIYDIQFFPEGGNLVSGLQSKVAFKATGPDGMGIDFKGAVINQKNDTVVRFAPSKFGMGNFLFAPAGDNTYMAVISFANSKPIVKKLPPIANQGYVMQLADNGLGQLDISVNSKSNVGDNVYLFIHTRQLVKVAKEGQLTNGVAHFIIDKNSLDEGISHITLFNRARQPVCERLYFKRPLDKLLIDATPDQQQYICRNKVNIAVATKNQMGNSLNADLSMSVYRVDGLINADQGDILSYLWLSSDLVGTVESPEYYFTNHTAESNEAADNLMLTQGWRRFEWSNILNNKPAVFSFLPETYGHIVTAKIVNSANNAPANGIINYLGVPGKRVQLFTAKSDSTGRLLFDTKDLYAGEIIVQPNPLRDTTYRIDVLSPFSEQYSQTPLPAFSVRPDMEAAFETRNVEMQIQNIYAGDRTKQFNEPITDSSGFYKNPDNSYLLDNYTRFTTMEEVLREYVTEVSVVRHQGKYHLRVAGQGTFLEDPLILLDGIPVFDADKLIATDPLAIRKLEVITNRYYYGPVSMEGIVSFTSYKGDLAGLEIDPHAVVVDYEGLQMQRVFYSPVYDTESQIKIRLADFRNLLFWSPSVNANDKNAVSFYTSDQGGQYIGVVQGIGANGEAGSCYFKFTVKK